MGCGCGMKAKTSSTRQVVRRVKTSTPSVSRVATTVKRREIKRPAR